jgi:hypothetical protein
MLLYLLLQVGDSVAIDVFLSEDDAREALAACIEDEPGWRDLLNVAPVDLRASLSTN